MNRATLLLPVLSEGEHDRRSASRIGRRGRIIAIDMIVGGIDRDAGARRHSARRRGFVFEGDAAIAEQVKFDARAIILLIDLGPAGKAPPRRDARSEEHTSELQSLMRISYAVFCLNKKN